MGTTASYLFGGNVTNLLLSMTDKKTKKFVVDLDDPAVRSICVAINGEALSPYVPPIQTIISNKKEEKIEKEVPPKDIKNEYWQSALFTTAGTTTLLGLSSLVPNSPMMSTFALSCWVGNSCVQVSVIDYYYLSVIYVSIFPFIFVIWITLFFSFIYVSIRQINLLSFCILISHCYLILFVYIHVCIGCHSFSSFSIDGHDKCYLRYDYSWRYVTAWWGFSTRINSTGT